MAGANKAGGLTIVQLPETSEVADIPEAAIAVAKPDHVLPLENIGPFLRKLESGGSE
jgi:two-component system chemotaxis response regulator CheB